MKKNTHNGKPYKLNCKGWAICVFFIFLLIPSKLFSQHQDSVSVQGIFHVSGNAILIGVNKKNIQIIEGNTEKKNTQSNRHTLNNKIQKKDFTNELKKEKKLSSLAQNISKTKLVIKRPESSREFNNNNYENKICLLQISNFNLEKLTYKEVILHQISTIEEKSSFYFSFSILLSEISSNFSIRPPPRAV